ncbi:MULTISPECIES: ABC transporter permease subunit [unclassified Thalassospira]|jgi:glutathione transport system permease protein|uniref:ABC transporter permease subunit n=1 Tax=unclassified Thalassospira TaxID=2648997 RepID=UPI000A1E2956|nr:ABC transporter permease subunit [Thalassospira sp. MCCC 1A01428]OSQ42517.1 glutathione ABC transporter permease [Thalassospira sp. MCCC 1A01428]
MVQYFLRRLFALIPVLFLISIFVFMFVHALPGDPARVLAGEHATLEEVEIVRRTLNLDAPLYQQYFKFIGNILSGNLGISLRTHEPVTTMIGRAFMPTVWLALCALGWSVLFGLISGVVSAVKRGSAGDHAGMFAAVSGISMPPFWLGLLLMQFFSVQLGWFGTSGFDSPSDLVLPSLTLGAGVAAIMARFTRSAVIEVVREDYIRTARAKGLKEKIVIWKHALRNALIPVVTMAGLQFGFLLGGSIVIEQVFRWPGMGALLLDAIRFRDYTVVQAEIMIFSLEFLLINLLVDVLYGLINPKIRYS